MVPLGVLEGAAELLELAEAVARKGNKNSVCDAGVAGLTAQAAGEGSYYNIRNNLPGIRDEKFKTRNSQTGRSFKEEDRTFIPGLKKIHGKHT